MMAATLHAYSVLTHEAIVDSAWDSDLKPLLLRRFPNATAEELREAHAHAYGGSIIQDMGYYPFGSRFFSDLVHYVRSGDFVVALMKESQTLRIGASFFRNRRPRLSRNPLASVQASRPSPNL